MKNTDFEAVKETSKMLFDAVEIKPAVKGCPICTHPYTNSTVVSYLDKNKDMQLKDVYEDKTALKDYREWIFKRIDRSDDIITLFAMINKPWLLTWLKYNKKNLSKHDFASLFAYAWISAENPNDDANVKIPELIRWFKNADKKSLMEKEDYKVWQELPEEFDVYRGVSVGRVAEGLSYTRDREKAEWFMNRFAEFRDKGGNGPYLLKARIRKEEALAYFNTRSEKEVVVDSLAIKDRWEII